MPRGFLVKRHYVAAPPRERRASEESDTYSDDMPTDLSRDRPDDDDLCKPPPLHPLTPYSVGTPDSGFSSPLQTLVERLRFDHHLDRLCLYADAGLHHEYSFPTQALPLALTTRSHPTSLLSPQSPFSFSMDRIVPFSRRSPPRSPSPDGKGLDLSIKATTPITPPSTPSPSSPTKRRLTSDDVVTPPQPQAEKKLKTTKKSKAVRRLNFDEDKTSPVSGTIIRELGEDEAPLVVRKGDIDPAYNVVEITEEAKAEIAKIENRIGDYICRLCKEMYEDAFSLAQHRCSRIVHVEYRCPECDKVFNCPANLASHRRWHKPRPNAANNTNNGPNGAETDPCAPVDLVKKDKSSNAPRAEDAEESGDDGPFFECEVCRKKFRRQAYLRKHLLTHRSGKVETPPTLSVQRVSPVPPPLEFSERSHPLQCPGFPPALLPIPSSPSATPEEKHVLQADQNSRMMLLHVPEVSAAN